MRKFAFALSVVCMGMAAIKIGGRTAWAQTDEDGLEWRPAEPRLRRDTFGARDGELSDRRIANQVRRAIFGDSALGASLRAVRVSAFNGVVTLRGEVASESQRSRIESAAARIVGSPKLVDDGLLIR